MYCKQIVNGRLDSTGEFTCFTPRGNSVVDYLIVSESLFTIISHFEVGNPSVHSDHCPLLVNLKIILDSSYCPKSASTYLKTKNQFREKNENIIWNQRIKGYVSKSFRSFKFCKLLETLESDLFCSRISLDEIVDQLLKNTIRDGKSLIVGHNKFPRNSWFDKDCKHQKRIVNTMASIYKRYPNNYVAKRN